ncbi:F-box protein At5g49610 [Lolium perenne]|uniref:F-box protein At5g49610 n=1 Tax=Lolium perenne TaxID=4522 RepID=UPI0021F616B9|nr:F-box protein At5g49610-like isoform X1 [Lolium perenne]
MDSKKVFTAGSLTDDIVVEILSRVPYKSFCRFKCVSKAWLAFSSDPHYCEKLPKIPTGLFHKGKDGSAVQLLSLSPNDEGIDGALTFLPHHEHLEFVDCCNGLVLCKYKSSYTSPDICRFIVCNPATREWRTLPDTHPNPYGPGGSLYTTLLAFDLSWSSQFYVFNFVKRYHDYLPLGVRELEVFSSEISMWLVDAKWSSCIQVRKSRAFIGGVLYVQTYSRETLVFKGLEAMISGIPPHHFTIKMQHDPWRLANGCFGQSSGFLQCAFPEESGDTVAVFNLDSCHPYKWSLKHRLSARDVFGKDDLVRSYGSFLRWISTWLLTKTNGINGLIFVNG